MEYPFVEYQNVLLARCCLLNHTCNVWFIFWLSSLIAWCWTMLGLILHCKTGASLESEKNVKAILSDKYPKEISNLLNYFGEATIWFKICKLISFYAIANESRVVCSLKFLYVNQMKWQLPNVLWSITYQLPMLTIFRFNREGYVLQNL